MSLTFLACFGLAYDLLHPNCFCLPRLACTCNDIDTSFLSIALSTKQKQYKVADVLVG